MIMDLKKRVEAFDLDKISGERKEQLQVLVDYVLSKVRKQEEVNLNFICTHNSRRSQFSQVWAKVAAQHCGIAINSFSGGVEVTEFNPRAVNSLIRFGFQIESDGSENPVYKVYFAQNESPINCFSKLYNHNSSPVENFAAVMTCSSADKNCPLIPGTEKRISLTYEDPKAFDGTEQEAEQYDIRSIQIGTELFYVFNQVKKLK